MVNLLRGFFSTTSGSTGSREPAEAGTPVALRAPFFPASAEISLGDDEFNGIVFIVITSTRPTLIFQWVGVSLTLAQRAARWAGRTQNVCALSKSQGIVDRELWFGRASRTMQCSGPAEPAADY